MKIFFTDAAFDHKNKTAILGVYELTGKEQFQDTFPARSPLDAELQGILRVSLFSQNESNVLIFNDSKKAVSVAKKRIFDEKLNPANRYLQIVWLPRDYMSLADHLSKVVSEKSFQEEISKVKGEAAAASTEKHASSLLQKHVNNLSPEEKPKQKLIERRLDQFFKLKNQEFKSSLFSSPKPFETIVNSPIEEIELIENDISSANDEILKILMKNILDLLILY